VGREERRDWKGREGEENGMMHSSFVDRNGNGVFIWKYLVCHCE